MTVAIPRSQLKPLSAAPGADQFNPIGTWTNELGSTMVITSFDGTGFAGTYSSAVSGSSQPVEGVLTGTISQGGIAFTVNWGGGSVTAWSGLLMVFNTDQFIIYALWHLAETPVQQANWWESILAGVDLFELQEQ
ncbi:MAG: avidin/streptavidin family protein [Allosphingosinicella sp.]